MLFNSNKDTTTELKINWQWIKEGKNNQKIGGDAKWIYFYQKFAKHALLPFCFVGTSKMDLKEAKFSKLNLNLI